MVVEIQPLAIEISSVPEVLYERGDLKIFSKFTDNHKKQSSRGVLSKDVLKNFAKVTDKYLCLILFFNRVPGWKPETARSSYWRCSVEKGGFVKGALVFQNQPFIDSLQNSCSWIIHKIHMKKTCVGVSF